MIKNIRIVFHNQAVWSEGKVYDSSGLVPYKSTREYRQSGRYVVFEKSYARGVPTITIWRELKERMTGEFFNIFYPSVVEQTSFYVREPDAPTGKYRPVAGRDGKAGYITDSLYQKQNKYPEKYGWSEVFNKFVLKPAAYIDAVGNVDMSVTDEEGNGNYGYDFLDILQERNHGKTLRIYLFVYPDRYDSEIRGIFELIITFWE